MPRGFGRLRLILLPILALTLISARPGLAQAVGTSPTVAGATPTAVANDSAQLVSEFEVNGLEVLFKRRPASQTVLTALYLRGGAANVTGANAGIEPLMLRVATEATENFPRERLRRELSSTGTEIGSAVRYDYSSLIMNSTLVHFDRSWEIFTDVATRPRFDSEDFVRTRNAMLASLSAAEDTPDAYLQALQSRAAFSGHPYMNDPDGTVESVQGLTADDVRRYHQGAMQTSRLLLVIVGDLELADVQRLVEASFGRLPRGDYVPQPLPSLQFSEPALTITPAGVVTNYVQGIYAAPPLTSPDYYPMRVATLILQSRVFEEVRERRNLSYAPDAFLWNRGASAGGIYVTADDANGAVDVMLNEIRRLQREPVEPGRLVSTAQHFLTTYYLQQETSAAQADLLAQYELIGGGWRNSEVFLEGVGRVTPADVLRVANTYMRNLQFVVLGNAERIDRTVFLRNTSP